MGMSRGEIPGGGDHKGVDPEDEHTWLTGRAGRTLEWSEPGREGGAGGGRDQPVHCL